MGAVTRIRQALATKLERIADLNTAPYMPDAVEPPIAVVGMPTIDYDLVMADGGNAYLMPIVLIVARVDEEAGQELADSYIDPIGDRSIKQAVERPDDELGDDGLPQWGGGAADSVRVLRAEPREIEIGQIQYLGYEIPVEVVKSE